MSEHNEQVALFDWTRWNERAIPELRMLYAIPNGGQRDVRVARKLKLEGVKPGVWDIALDVARGKYHGLRIEMKFGKNKLTANQQVWEKQYTEQGYKTAICYTWETARDAIMGYLQL